MTVENAPPPGTVIPLQDRLECVLAPNPSPMTFWGTNTYILGNDHVAVIDPGPLDDGHLHALLAAIAGRTVSHIIVTHSHLDHSPLARPLAAQTGAPVLAFGPSDAGRSEIMQQLAAHGLAGGGEGVDLVFAPDAFLADGDVVTGDGWALKVLHTPGHMGNHIAVVWEDAVFSGDTVMGWASSLVSPPDGDLTDFMRSLDRLEALDARVFYSGHGAPIHDPGARIRWLRDHRLAREAQIRAALKNEPSDATAITQAVYTDIPKAMLPAATRNVFAHLVDLYGRDLVDCRGPLAIDATFHTTAIP